MAVFYARARGLRTQNDVSRPGQSRALRRCGTQPSPVRPATDSSDSRDTLEHSSLAQLDELDELFAEDLGRSQALDIRREVRARTGLLGDLRALHSKSTLYGAFVWAHRSLKIPKPWFPSRAVPAPRRPAVREDRADPGRGLAQGSSFS